MKKSLVYTGLVVLVCLFLFTFFNLGTALAQDSDISTTTVATSEEETETAEEELPSDVAFDEKVTREDLGADEAGILPGNPLHFFKRAGWAFQEIFEIDPVADAELKIKHANQELSELKQLIEKQGFSNVSPGTINSVMNRFEERLDNLNNVAEALKNLKESNPEAVNTLLNNLTDKQFKYQKVLESIERDVIKEKEDNENSNKEIEDVFVKISETKNKTLKHYGKVMETVEDGNQENIAERIIRVADKQEGSEFKHLKNFEILKRLEGQVPESARGAITLAQENTLKFFNRDIASLSEEDRAGRFEQYNRFNYGDETRQLSFLDDLKSLEDVPPEILKKIEEVKEFAISKFEKKMSNFKNKNVLDNYMQHLSGENFDDIVLAEQFASRVVFEDNPEIKQRMDEIRNNSVQEFTKRFTDPNSQAQIAKFQELEKALEKNPGDPKIIKMMQELESQVRSDPAKAVFLDQISQLENKMGAQFEEKFRQEGDQYFDRIGTLDPRDFEVYQAFKGENFLPEDLANKFLDHGVDKYRDYMKDVNNPEQFDRFNSKFGNVPQFIIDDIRSRDSEFGDAMQFKRQAMEKLRFEEDRQREINRNEIDYKERELFHQLDRERRQADDEFWRKVNSIPYENFDERKTLFEEKRNADLARLNEENKARLEVFNKRLELDPWCDSACKQIQRQFIDQEFRHQKERIQDDYIANQNKIEFDLKRRQEEQKKNFEENKDYDCGENSYFDFKENKCISYRIAPKCPEGSFLGPDGICQKEDFQCPDIATMFPAPCPAGQNRDIITGFNGCKIFSECRGGGLPVACPVFDLAPCPDGQYREGGYQNADGCWVPGSCIVNNQTQCPDLSLVSPLSCPDGQYRETIADQNGCKVFGECVGELTPPVTCDAYFEGYVYNTATNRCELQGSSGCSNPYKYKTITECQEGNVTSVTPTYPTASNWVNHTWYFSDGSTSSSILNRTDAEYTNYIASIEAQCKNISQSSFGWKQGAGDDSASNWQNFGIPDCSGNANPNTYPTTTYVGDSGCETILDILPGCHLMSESPDVRFNSAMDQYVQVGTRNIQYCSSELIPGCTSYSYSNTTTNSGSSVMQKCFYPNATINNAPTGFTVWCEADYYNCHQGDPSGASVSLSNLSLGAPSFCESGYTGGGSDSVTPSSEYCGDNICSSYETSSSCPVDCGSASTNTSTYCTPPAYWDFAIQACNWDSSTTSSCEGAGGFECPSGYKYDSSGCVSGCLQPPPPPTTDTATTTNTPANVWDAIKLLFGL